MKTISIKNKRIDVSRLDEITIRLKIKRSLKNIKLKVWSTNGDIEQWDGASKKDVNLLHRFKDGNPGWDEEILDHLLTIIEIQP